MVLLSLSAMAGLSKILQPSLNNNMDESLVSRYREVSKYLLLSSGLPTDWGRNKLASNLSAFGLARGNSQVAYELDIDKVSRLNSENAYSLTYAQVFTAFQMSDVSFRLEIRTIFEVEVALTATFPLVNSTVYEFEILTSKHGAPVHSELVCYAVAEDYLALGYEGVCDGLTSSNVTISNSFSGPVLLVVFARSIDNVDVVSFGTCYFAHNSGEPKPNGSFLRLSPLNSTLEVSFAYSEANVSKAYALTFSRNFTLTEVSNNNESAIYEIPPLLRGSPIIIVATGRNSTESFEEWVAYPQLPVQIGANFADYSTLSSVFAYTYLVSIDYALYECTVHVGGLQE